jgi:transposase
MRRVREILRYRFEQGLGHKAISYRVGAAPSTVRETLRRAAVAGLAWPLGADVSDAVLEAALYRAAGTKTGHRRCPEPDWAAIHRELKRKHVTLQIVWDEYIAQHPEGYRYSRFCDLYRGWAAKLPVTMRQTHAAGEKLFVDYAGDKVAVVVDRLTGEIRDAHIFVAVLGASSLSYAEASWTETLPDWIAAHVRALEAFGGAPALFVPDNAKVAVIKACLYDPQVNRSYAEMAAHYDSAVLPTRPRRPRDKAKVEACVLIVERWLFGRLRHRIFYSLAELNAAIGDLLADLNDRRIMRRVGQTRRQLFEAIDRPALKALPLEPYVFAEWRRRRAGLDYHVEIERHYYSVPYRFAREPVEARITARTIELFHKGERIAAHMRGSGNGRHDDIRAYAVIAPALRRLDDRTHRHRGGRDRPLCRPAVRENPDRSPASRAGLPGLPGHRAPGEGLRPRTGRSGVQPGARYRRTHLWIGPIDPRQPARSGARAPAARDDRTITHPNIRGSRYYH